MRIILHMGIILNLNLYYLNNIKITYSNNIICEVDYDAVWRDSVLNNVTEKIKLIYYRNGLVVQTQDYGFGILKTDTFIICKNKVYYVKNNIRYLYFNKKNFMPGTVHYGLDVMNTSICSNSKYIVIKKDENDSLPCYVMEHDYICNNRSYHNIVYYNPIIGAFKITTKDSNIIMSTNIRNTECMKLLGRKYKKLI